MNKFRLSLVYFTVATLVLKLFLKWRHKRKLKILEEEKTNSQYYHQCKFINMKQFNCRTHFFDRNECCEHCSVAFEKEMTTFISSAKISICMCMYMVSLREIIFAMINASKRGVKIRIITDNVMLKTDVMQQNFERLEKYGIPYKTQSSHNGMMHHKFCLIDKEDPELAKLLFGSLNFTMQAITKNFDNLIITNNENILHRFSEEFEDLWNEF